jgi:putative spermidine/putrescine transport system substrate-binding protein
MQIRHFSAPWLGALLAAAVFGASAQTVNVVSFGGAYQEGQSKALFQPAAKARKRPTPASATCA